MYAAISKYRTRGKSGRCERVQREGGTSKGDTGEGLLSVLIRKYGRIEHIEQVLCHCGRRTTASDGSRTCRMSCASWGSLEG